MRKYMNLVEFALEEDDLHDKKNKADPALKTDVADKPDHDIHFDTPTTKGELTPAGGGNLPAEPLLPGKRASKRKTATSMKAIADPAQAGQHLGNLAASGMQDEIDDAEAARRAGVDPVGGVDTAGATPLPPTPENLPAVIRDAMLAVPGEPGQPVIEPQWHMVKHLPGYMQSAIRAMGRQVFSPFTDTPIEDIQVLSTLSNDAAEVKYMMAWIKHNGVRDDRAELQFDRIMPGYHAEVQLWRTQGYEFMLVRDFGGFYVYGWPGGRGVHVDGPGVAPRRLR